VAVKSALPYDTEALITAVKSFIQQAHEFLMASVKPFSKLFSLALMKNFFENTNLQKKKLLKVNFFF
jgi:hypothetical protein